MDSSGGEGGCKIRNIPINIENSEPIPGAINQDINQQTNNQQPDGEENPKQSQQTEPCKNEASRTKDKNCTNPNNEHPIIYSVKNDLASLINKLVDFSGLSNEEKQYRYLDEMFTRCVLNLDNIDCSGNPDLKQKRKAAITLVNKAATLLEKKLEINKDLDSLKKNLPEYQDLNQ